MITFTDSTIANHSDIELTVHNADVDYVKEIIIRLGCQNRRMVAGFCATTFKFTANDTDAAYFDGRFSQK